MSGGLSLRDLRSVRSVDELWNLVGTVEHEGLDFKRGVPDDIRETMPAMAMTSGGIIIHGIDDRRQIVGCPLSQNTQDRITRYANECGLEVAVAELDLGDVKLTAIEVPEVVGRIVTTPDGRLLRRVGGDCQPLVGDAMARFVRSRTESSAEEDRAPNLSSSEIDLDLLNELLVRDRKSPTTEDGVIRVLGSLGVATMNPDGTGVPLRAAAILFARDPTVHIPGACIQLVRRTGIGPGPGPASDRTECSGPLQHLLACALEFIDRHTKRYEVVRGTQREVFPEYPATVLREAVLNALAHRDYGLRSATIDITVWDDRIEIRSPGSLPGHITTENMRLEHYSRNRRLMRILKLAGLVEEYGEGVDRMFDDMEARLMDPPTFVASSTSVTVILRNRVVVSIEDQVWLGLLARYDLTPADRRVLVLTRNNGTVTPRQVRSVLPDIDVENVLAGAVARGLLERRGERGGGHYALSAELVLRAGSQGLDAQSRKLQLLNDEMRRRGSISTTEASALLDEDIATVRHLLNGLVRAGTATAEGQTRARRYRLR